MQLIVLLSALLASLTGLVAGERPAERAQVERSVVAAFVQASEAEVPAQARPLTILLPFATLLVAIVALAAAPVLRTRARLLLKQSWLH